jgi:hypothetical protein
MLDLLRQSHRSPLIALRRGVVFTLGFCLFRACWETNVIGVQCVWQPCDQVVACFIV